MLWQSRENLFILHQTSMAVLSTRDILLEYVSPALGAVFANLMFLAPLSDVRRAVQTGSLGHLNPTPWAVMTGNTIGWITYSYLLNVRAMFFVLVTRCYIICCLSNPSFIVEPLYLLGECTGIHIFDMAQHGGGKTTVLR